MPYNISIKFHPIPSTLNFSRFCGNGDHSEISKPQNYVYTCQTKFLESFIQSEHFKLFVFFCGFHGNGGHFENSESSLLIYSVLNIHVKFGYQFATS